MSSSSNHLPVPEGPGSVSGAPSLPAGFTDTFAGRYVDTDELRQHVVVGGDGPPLLLVNGWPQTWYAWRHVMPALAADFQVVAVDQRGSVVALPRVARLPRRALHSCPEERPRSGRDTLHLSGAGLSRHRTVHCGSFYGLCAARLRCEGWPAALFQAAMVALIGGFLIGLKALLH